MINTSHQPRQYIYFSHPKTFGYYRYTYSPRGKEIRGVARPEDRVRRCPSAVQRTQIWQPHAMARMESFFMSRSLSIGYLDEDCAMFNCLLTLTERRALRQLVALQTHFNSRHTYMKDGNFLSAVVVRLSRNLKGSVGGGWK